AVVLELDGRPGLGLDRADHLAPWADDLPDLVRLDLDRLDPRRPSRELGARLGDDAAHRFDDEEARLAGLLERGPHDVERDSLDLDIHLQRGDALCGASDLEVHVAVVIFEALDVREDGPSVAVRHQTHSDADEHIIVLYTSIHPLED